ncbi:MAG: alpha/beta hydrolase [Betaproteobacteria bacterium]
MRPAIRYARTIERRPSWRSVALNTLLRLTMRRRLAHDADVVALRRQYEKLDARRFRTDPAVKRTAVDCGAVPAEWIDVPETRPGRVILYLHGGSFAFRFPNAHAALAARLCRQLGARALIPDYRLAPEHPFPAAPDDCMTAYRWLLSAGVDPASVVLAGDSAGGNLALVTLHRARAAGLPLPACAVLLSPALDCTMSSPSMAAHEGRDPMLQLANLLVLRQYYVASPHEYTNPEVSPLFADFRGFPPLFLQVGADEMLRDEAMRAADKAHAAGVDVELELWPGVAHVFQIAGFLPESAHAINNIARFVRLRTKWDDVRVMGSG